MADRHELAANALECAVFGLPEPRTEWRREIPTLDWKTARGGGSPNINGMAAVADMHYAKPGRARELAVGRLENYVRFCRQQWLLAEPETGIYRQWHLNYLAGAVEILRRLGMDALADRFLWILEEDAERSALMSAVLTDPYLPPNQNAPRIAQDRLQATISARVGETIICRMGARSWGSGGSGGYGVDAPWQQTARAVLTGGAFPPSKGTPGDLDGYSWTMRVARRLEPIFREAGAEARTLSVDELVDGARHWSPSHTPFQYLGWEDGSRLCVMGNDEPEFVDEDPNSNTPGVLAYGVLGGRICYLPEWPNPINGAVKIRQQNMRADADIEGGQIVLLHSHIGRSHTQNGYLRTVRDLPTSPLLFHLVQPRWGEWRSFVEPPTHPVPGDPQPPTRPTPPTPSDPTPPRPSLWQRIIEWFERLVD